MCVCVGVCESVFVCLCVCVCVHIYIIPAGSFLAVTSPGEDQKTGQDNRQAPPLEQVETLWSQSN